MQITNAINNLIQLDKKLDINANNIKKITQSNGNSDTKGEMNLKKELSKKHEDIIEDQNSSIEDELIEEEVTIPIAYTANAKVISIKNSTAQTLLDIKV